MHTNYYSKMCKTVTVVLILEDQMTLLNASLTNQDNVVFVKQVVVQILSKIVLMNCIHIMANPVLGGALWQLSGTRAF